MSAASLQVPPNEPMTTAQFLEWNPGDGRAWQLVDGVPQAMAPAKRTHGALQGRMSQVIGNHLDATGGLCSVVVAPGVMPKLDARHNVRIPDLAVTCSPYADEEAVLTDPILLIEILSPSNRAETWSNIWAYTSIPTVMEILLLETAAIGARVWRRQSDGAWPAEPRAVAADEDLVLDSIGLTIPLSQVYLTTRLARVPSSARSDDNA